jgi:uncharacterized membrane protein YeiB
MTAPVTPAPAARAALPRALAPDMARGVMLLLIALAHAPLMVSDRTPSIGNALTELVKALLADNQARSMFILLFGYGMGQLLARQERRGIGAGATRRLLRRRGLVLVAVGLAHHALLVPLDIVAVYGAALLILTPMVTARDRALLGTAVVALPFAVAVIALGTRSSLAAEVAGELTGMVPYMAGSYPAHVVSDLATWLPETVLSVIVVAPGMALGIWAARRGYLDEPRRHTAALRRTAAVLLLAALVARLPEALAVMGTWAPTSRVRSGPSPWRTRSVAMPAGSASPHWSGSWSRAPATARAPARWPVPWLPSAATR